MCQEFWSTWYTSWFWAQDRFYKWHSQPEKNNFSTKKGSQSTQKNLLVVWVANVGTWLNFQHCHYVFYVWQGPKCNILNLILFPITFMRYGIGERVFFLVLTLVSFVYIITIIVMVTVSDQVSVTSNVSLAFVPKS